MDLPLLDSLDVSGKRVLLRLDLDTEPDPNDFRIKASGETLDWLKNHGASKIIIIGHKGRPASAGPPAGEASASARQALSLKPFQPLFDKWDAKVEENLRFNPGEEKNDPEFAKKLAEMGDVYVNDAFAASHREHASIVALPQQCKSKCKGKCVATGFHFVKEIENLSKVLDSPNKPVVAIVGGVKEDKLSYLEGIKSFAGKILIGGRLPEFMGEEGLVSVRVRGPEEKVIVGNLTMDKEDITINTIERFEEEIKKAGTVVLAGPMGKYEEEGHRQGTERVFGAVVATRAFKVAGGGDTEKAVISLGLSLSDFDWVSVGGGAMLEFLTKKTLPGIEALK